MEEVRKVCMTSLETLQRVSSEAAILSDAVFSYEQLVDSINGALKKQGNNKKLKK